MIGLKLIEWNVDWYFPYRINQLLGFVTGICWDNQMF